MPTLQQLIQTSGFSLGALQEADFLTGNTVISAATAETNINGDGTLTLQWKSTHGGCIDVGARITYGGTEYVMLRIYTPAANDDGTYNWAPVFTCADALLDKVLFYYNFVTAGDSMELYTFPYVGLASTVVENIQRCAREQLGNGYSVVLHPTDAHITVAFDADTIKGAAGKVASALGVNIVIIDGTIHIGGYEAYSVDEYFNRFIILGGTRNMSKKSISGQNVAVTQRLMLPTGYAGDGNVKNGSILDLSNGEPPMVKMLVFDSIYPKMELVIRSVRHRDCYMCDENGKVIDHYELNGSATDGSSRPYSADTPNAVPVYKQYTKWYVKLGILAVNSQTGNEEVAEYDFNKQILIAGQPLGMVFQSGPLTGRQFDLHYYEQAAREHADDDVSDTAFDIDADEFYILLQADGDVLLPTNVTDGLVPQEGNTVTLVNVALDRVYEQKAIAELYEAGTAMAQLYHSRKAPSFEQTAHWTDFLTGGVPSFTLGNPYNDGDYIITGIRTDIITGVVRVMYGTFRPEGLLQSMANKLEGPSVSGGSATTDDDTRKTAPMSAWQYNALRQAGGSLGMVSVNERINNNADELERLSDTISEVQQQADRKFDIWHGTGTPWPLQEEPVAWDEMEETAGRSQYPAIDWNTDALRELHVQDIYYDMNREAMSTGGKTFRYSKNVVGDTTAYYWDDITDADTAAALEQITDIASDGFLTGGAEKVRVLIEWFRAAHDYACNAVKEEVTALDEWSAYDTAYKQLYIFLNDGTDPTEQSQSGEDDWTQMPVPSLLASDGSEGMLYTTSEIDPQEYYDCWEIYYDAYANLTAAAIRQASNTAARALAIMTRMSNDNILTAAEKAEILRQWQNVYAERLALHHQAVTNHKEATTAYTDYEAAYIALGCYLTDLGTTTTQQAGSVSQTPAMLTDGEDTFISSDVFNALWRDYYEKRALLMQTLTVRNTQTFVQHNIPSTPYYKGDYWYRLALSGSRTEQILLCTHDREMGDGQMSDWIDYQPNINDARILLGNLVDLLWSRAKEVTNGVCDFAALLANHPKRVIIDLGWQADGQIAFYNDKALYYYNSQWIEIADSVFTDSMRAVYALLGRRSITVYGERPSQASEYDVYTNRIKFTRTTIDGNAIDYEGGIEVLVYDGKNWQLAVKSINSLMQNLGSIINLMVFGNTQDSSVNAAAGQYIRKHAIELFAEAQVWDSEKGQYVKLTEALFGLSVVQDSNGHWVSSARLKASLIDFESDNFRLSADKVEITGNILVDTGIESRGSDTFIRMADGMLTIGMLSDYKARISVFKDGHGVFRMAFYDENGENPLFLDRTLLASLIGAASVSQDGQAPTFSSQPFVKASGNSASWGDAVSHTPSIYFKCESGSNAGKWYIDSAGSELMPDGLYYSSSNEMVIVGNLTVIRRKIYGVYSGEMREKGYITSR